MACWPSTWVPWRCGSNWRARPGGAPLTPGGAVDGLRGDDDKAGGPGMTAALCLLAVQGVIGAFDTLYYHEWRARLPARGRHAASELKLHAARDFFYGVLFATLSWIAWQGAWVLLLVA